MLYEVIPMSYLVSKAGGKATTGPKNIMELTPENIHSTSPIILGSKDEVELVEKYYHEKGKKWLFIN